LYLTRFVYCLRLYLTLRGWST